MDDKYPGTFFLPTPDQQEKPNTHYSSQRKEFYGPVPAHSQDSGYAPVEGEFDIGRCGQTDIMKIISGQHQDNRSYTVSLAEVIKKRYGSIGLIRDKRGDYQGTCILISSNLALTARHVIEGEKIQNFIVQFEYYVGSQANDGQYEACNIVEDDEKLDYVIIQLAGQPGIRHGYMEFSVDSMNSSSVALLHYPLEKPLKVSVHTFVYGHPCHDADFGSSGGAYITSNGKCVALHLGSNLMDDYNLLRHALNITTIVEKNSQNLLLKLIKGSQNPVIDYEPTFFRFYLNPVERDYLEVETKEWRRRREEQKTKYREITHAEERTIARLEQHPTENYEVMSVRALATYFPEELGLNIFNNQKHTPTNKTIFENDATGWYVCYDKLGDYSTVHNELNHYVALDRSTDPAGRDDKYHFRNKEKAVSFNNALGFVA